MRHFGYGMAALAAVSCPAGAHICSHVAVLASAHIKYIMNNMEHEHYTPQHIDKRWHTLHSTKAVVHRDSRYTLTTFRTRRKWTRD